MERFYAGRSRPSPWSQPDGIVAASVDPGTGMVLAPGCLPLAAAPYRELFVSSRVPRETCPARGDLPTVEPFMDYGTEMDEEIMEVPLDAYEPDALPPAPAEVEAEEAELAEPELPEQEEPSSTRGPSPRQWSSPRRRSSPRRPAPADDLATAAPPPRPQPTPAVEPAVEPPPEAEPEPPAPTSPAPSEPPL